MTEEVPSCGLMVQCRRVTLLLLLSVAPAMAEPLPVVVDKVLQRHPEVRASAAMVEMASERIKQNRSEFYPTVGLDVLASQSQDRDLLGGEQTRRTRRTELFMRWDLFRGFGHLHGLRAAESDQLAAMVELEDVSEGLALEVTAAYVDVWRLRQRLELAESYAQETTRLADEVRKRVDVGRAAQLELDQVRLSRIDADWQTAQLRAQLTSAEARYRLLVGEAPGEVSAPSLESVLSELTLDDVLERVLQGNRRVRAGQLRSQARAEDIGVAAAALYPTLSLEMRRPLHSHVVPQPVTDTRGSTQLQLRYEMPLGGANYSRKREAAARLEAARANVDSIWLEINVMLEQSWYQYQEGVAIAPALQERSQASAQLVAGYDLQFTAGRRSLQDLIAVRAEYQRIQADLLDNKAERLRGSAQLLSLMGGLVPTLLEAEAGASALAR